MAELRLSILSLIFAFSSLTCVSASPYLVSAWLLSLFVLEKEGFAGERASEKADGSVADVDVALRGATGAVYGAKLY